MMYFHIPLRIYRNTYDSITFAIKFLNLQLFTSISELALLISEREKKAYNW
jgi:hypothetical protein